MGNKKRTVVDDFIEGLQQILGELEQILDPEKRKKRNPVPVPVPVRRDENPRHYPPR